MKYILLTALLLNSLNAFSADNQYEYETLNIDGVATEKDSSSSSDDQSEELKKIRARLEKQNEEMVKKQIEKMRYLSELKINKKLQNQMNAILQSLK